MQPNDYISEMGMREGGTWVWQFKWRRPLFIWESEVLKGFLELFVSVPITLDEPSWEFRLDVNSGFSVKVNYLFLSKKLSPTG
jgi:hypothetical protein